MALNKKNMLPPSSRIMSELIILFSGDNSAHVEKIAICLNNTDYPVSLELHKAYHVLRDDAAQANGDLRVIDESGDDYLYPADLSLHPLKNNII